MPPRYAYWTIIVDDQPTAFRASAQEDLMPTLKRLQAKNATAKMMWWQNGKLWNSRHEAQDAIHMRGEMGRRGDSRHGGGGFRDRDRKPFGDRARKPFRDRGDGAKRSAWTPRGEPSTPQLPRDANDKLEWKPKGEFVPAPKRVDRAERPRSVDRERKPEWKPKSSFDRDSKPAWRPKGSGDRDGKPAWRPKASGARDAKPAWKPKASGERYEKPSWKPKSSVDRGAKPAWKPKRSSAAGDRASTAQGKLEWKPKGESSDAPPKRKWVPKEEYKKALGIEAKRDKNWRPGGEHKDPRQKYKDAKKAKWTRFKKNIRSRWEAKGKKKGDD
ncbi:MAG: hypothetical protein ACKOEC_20900 [Acidimicrobiia bacterium]